MNGISKLVKILKILIIKILIILCYECKYILLLKPEPDCRGSGPPAEVKN